MTKTRSMWELWLLAGISQLTIYLQQIINPTIPIMISFMLMPNLFLAGHLILKSKDRRPQSLSLPKTNIKVDSKRKHRSSTAPPHEFSSRHNLRGKIFEDALGRERIRWPRWGLLNVFLYAVISHKSTSAMHVYNLTKILKPIVFGENKRPVIIICDGGPDWTTKSTPNLINFGRLWQDLKTQYCPLCIARLRPFSWCWKIWKAVFVSEIRLHRLFYYYSIAHRYWFAYTNY